MSECLALRTTGPDGRFICDRTDPHPSVFGSDDEGHHWVQVAAEQWDAAMAALSTDM